MNTALLDRAFGFLDQAYAELEMTDALIQRKEQVEEQIRLTGTWELTSEELTHGARMAWRNSNRCIGRLYWKTLKVIDARSVVEPDDIFNALQHHIDYAYNGGDIRSVITVFRQRRPEEKEGPRIVNHQLVRFAGHRNADGSITGDSAEVLVTEHCMKLGWKGEGTRFDLLPHVIRWPGMADKLRMPVMPEGIRVPIRHPEFAWFEELDLQWYAVPIISDMMLEIGGVEFTAAPFNGWYMGTEIGSRNFSDTDRYNMLPEIARRLGLDTRSYHSLWQDRAMLELNRAVLYSYEKAGVTISNHHDASEQFVHFEHQEEKHGRQATADWVWITPPMSASSTPVYHRLYDNTMKGPNFFYQDPCLGKLRFDITPGCPFHAASLTAAKQKG